MEGKNHKGAFCKSYAAAILTQTNFTQPRASRLYEQHDRLNGGKTHEKNE